MSKTSATKTAKRRPDKPRLFVIDPDSPNIPDLVPTLAAGWELVARRFGAGIVVRECPCPRKITAAKSRPWKILFQGRVASEHDTRKEAELMRQIIGAGDIVRLCPESPVSRTIPRRKGAKS